MKKQFSLLILFALLTVVIRAQTGSQFFPKEDLMSLGIYYYPEHWDKSEWERDIKNIADIGFEFIHIAEFAWVELEPEEGVYTFEWLDEVVRLAGKYRLKVIMGTPTAITPVWMGIRCARNYI